MVVVMMFLLFFLVSCSPSVTVSTEKKCTPRVTILKGVNFDTAKATLKAKSYQILDKNIMTMKTNPKITVTIVGHTDSNGADEDNQKLSEDRANTVMQYFAKKGIAEDRMRAIGKGETVPIADNRTARGRAQNRRIELEFADPDPTIICK